MSIPSLPGGGSGAGGAGPVMPGQFNPQDADVQKYVAMMTGAMQSCYVKTVMAGGMGFGMGAIFGMFMASVSLFPLPVCTLLCIPPPVRTFRR